MRCSLGLWPKSDYFSTVMRKSTRSKGRPAHEPSAMARRFVEAMARSGVPQSEIAAVIAVTTPTLRKHYRGELQRGAAIVETRLASHLLHIASGKDGTALKAIIFALQCRFGWTKFAPPPPR
jgi:hypothetical protein